MTGTVRFKRVELPDGLTAVYILQSGNGAGLGLFAALSSEPDADDIIRDAFTTAGLLADDGDDADP